LKVFKYHPELKVCYHDIKKDYENIKYMKNTFEVYDYFLQYTNGEKNHYDLYIKYKPHGYLSSWSISDYLKRNYPNECKRPSYIFYAREYHYDIVTDFQIQNSFKVESSGNIRISNDKNC